MVWQIQRSREACGKGADDMVGVAIRNSMATAKDHTLALLTMSWDNNLDQREMLGMVKLLLLNWDTHIYWRMNRGLWI